MQAHVRHPWNVPVPVRNADFRSLFPQHEHCNVVAAWERVGAFGAPPRPVPDDVLLYADHQANLHLHVSGRMGSGRAGFYQGLFLKGIGRTPLAGNWNSTDTLHNSGHLAATSAIREYVISAYVRAAGAESTIVPCQGVLLSPLSSELAGLRDLLLEDFPEKAMPPADDAIQAITVKPGNFARISNFAWLLHHLTPGRIDEARNSLSRFAKLLAAALSEPGSGPPADPGKISPKSLVTQLEAAIARTSENFKRWLELGIWWGSFGNNHTVDGRFLDLETPSVCGGVFFGRLSSRGILPGRVHNSAVVGTEIFYHLLQMQRFCQLAVQTLSNLPTLFHSTERDFGYALAEEIQTRLLHEDSILCSKERAVELGLDLYADAAASLSAPALAALRQILGEKYDRTLGSETYREPSEQTLGAGIALEIPPLVTEPGVRWRFQALRLAGDEAILPTPEAQERARGLNALIDELDATTDLDDMLSKLADAERRIRALFRDAASSPSITSGDRDNSYPRSPSDPATNLAGASRRHEIPSVPVV